jgi:hypothetical protein
MDWRLRGEGLGEVEGLARRVRGLPTMQWLPRTGLALWLAREPSPPRPSQVVLAGRATRVPEGAGTSGMQRTTTVTRRKRSGSAHGSDLGWGRRPKLHGMQGVRGSNPLSSTRHNTLRAPALGAACQRFARKPRRARANHLKKFASSSDRHERPSPATRLLWGRAVSGCHPECGSCPAPTTPANRAEQPGGPAPSL